MRCGERLIDSAECTLVSVQCAVLVAFGYPCAFEHTRSAAHEEALAGAGYLAPILLYDSQSRTLTDGADFGHILSISSESGEPRQAES
jgi:hypothetical protein